MIVDAFSSFKARAKFIREIQQMSHVETRLMHYFVAVAEEQHFGQAALRLGISPPTLTNQIQKLESQLGTKLLRRKGNTKVDITQAGQSFLTEAREALRHVEQAATAARKAGRGESGRLELGFLASLLSADRMESWVGDFQQAHPAIEITIRRVFPMAQINGILRNELDAGFTRAPNKYPSGVHGFEIYRQRLVLALRSDHPLARHEDISPAMLAGEAFVGTTPEVDIGFFGYIEAIARIGNFVPRLVKRQLDSVAVLGYVALRHGIAVVPELMKTTNFPNVVFRNIAADPVPQVSFAFVYGSDPSPSAKLLIRHMRRHAARNGGKGAAPRHNQDPVITPSALNVDPRPNVDQCPNIDPHTEVLARRASLEGCRPRRIRNRACTSG
jgi:DNA-binding transcriptional LysR family regulator